MKRSTICLLMFLASVMPGISLAATDLSGNWDMTITSIDPAGNVNSQTVTMSLTLVNPGFYYGTIGGESPFMTLVQQGKKIRFTVSCTNETTDGCDSAMPGEHRTNTWGTGIANKNKINVTWSDDIGLTGTGEAVRR